MLVILIRIRSVSCQCLLTRYSMEAVQTVPRSGIVICCYRCDQCIVSISVMREVNLRSVDLNLLVVLSALLEHRHVSRAALVLNMSQPAVSRALQRLRDTFADPLLVRTVKGYDLSARALLLQPQLSLLLSGLEQLIEAPQFVPERADNLIKLTGLDLDVALYVPQLIRLARQQAPNMRFEVVVQQTEQFASLDNGEVHFCLTAEEPQVGADQIHRMELDRMDVVGLMDAANPLAAQPMSLESYAAANHGLVSITGLGPGLMDAQLARFGLSRTVKVRLASFMSVADFCEGTDLLFALPERLARYIARHRNLVIRPLPPEVVSRQVVFYLYWHQRYHQDPACIWLREQITGLRTSGALTPPGAVLPD